MTVSTTCKEWKDIIFQYKDDQEERLSSIANSYIKLKKEYDARKDQVFVWERALALCDFENGVLDILSSAGIDYVYENGKPPYIADIEYKYLAHFSNIKADVIVNIPVATYNNVLIKLSEEPVNGSTKRQRL